MRLVGCAWVCFACVCVCVLCIWAFLGSVCRISLRWLYSLFQLSTSLPFVCLVLSRFFAVLSVYVLFSVIFCWLLLASVCSTNDKRRQRNVIWRPTVFERLTILILWVCFTLYIEWAVAAYRIACILTETLAVSSVYFYRKHEWINCERFSPYIIQAIGMCVCFQRALCLFCVFSTHRESINLSGSVSGMRHRA